MAAEPLTGADKPGRPAGAPRPASPRTSGPARGVERVAALDDSFTTDPRFAHVRTRGRRTGAWRSVTIGYVDEDDGSILVAAGSIDRAWAANLLADPAVQVDVAGRRFTGEAEVLDDRDPRRGKAVRELILRFGTPSEGLGSGPVFVIRPAEPA